MKAHKEKLNVIIYTAYHMIKGEVHLYENSRLTDILNADAATKDFLPVTNATVTDLRSRAEQNVSFLSINRRHIEVVMEDDEAIALAKAQELLGKRKFLDALKFAQRAVSADPKNPEAHFVLGFCLAKGNQTAEAKKSFNLCLALNPEPELKDKAQDLLGTLVG